MKKLITVIVIILILCSGSAAAMEPIDEYVMLYGTRDTTVEDAVAVALELPNYEEEIVIMTEILSIEAPYCAKMEQAAVIWCILNRVDADGFGDTITAVATANHQFAYVPGRYIEPELKQKLRSVVCDVLTRWLLEKRGVGDVGRVLPREYCFFAGDGKHNLFRDKFSGDYEYYNWSLANPYEE